ncbi:hypothetical protein [Dapis sp. BLCC M229]|uniref:hypothetical protein n=1 Tax=Dapis sp. BLCC M229 TaxID=3400188 RepID=UPI003CF606BC
MAETNVANTTIISWENFRDKMTEKYRKDFIDKVTEHSGGSIDQDKTDNYFRTFVKALYDNRVEGIGPGYGYFYEGGAAGEKGRQNLVAAFQQEMQGFIREFAPLAAQGSTLLWSSYPIGRFAAEDSEILKSAGVKDENAQTLNNTQIGELWDKLNITGLLDQEDKAIGYIWDNQYNVWASVSKEFASNAKGEVHVFLPKNIAASTVFWNVELPELRKNMAEFTEKPKSEQVSKITIHRLTDDALKRVGATIDSKDENARREIMLDSSSWQNLDFSEATLDVPDFSDKQKRLLQDSNPLLFARMDNYVASNKTAGSITISKLTEIARRWKDKASSSSIDYPLYQKIARKYGHIRGISPSLVSNIEQGIATDNQIKQYSETMVKHFLDNLRDKEPQNYNESDLEIVTHLLYQNYTRLQQTSGVEMSTKVISKAEIENLFKQNTGDPALSGFSNLNQYSQKLSAQETIGQFGLDYQYQNTSGEIVKPYLMSTNGQDQALPFVYYVTTPITDDIKTNAKIPLDPTVKTRLEAIANDTNRDDNDELKKMAKELTTPGIYHELTPNTDNDLPRYGTQADGKKSYASMLRTTYSPTSAQLSTGAMIRAKGPNGEDFKIADWNGLTWNISPENSFQFPDWMRLQGRSEDRLNVETELTSWKRTGDEKMTPPTNIPAPVRAFMEHHFQTDLTDVTIQKVNYADSDNSTDKSIKFKPGEYNDTTEAGLKKIAEKLRDTLTQKNFNTSDLFKAMIKINNELPTKSVSIKNDLIIARQEKLTFKALLKDYKKKYGQIGKSSSVSAGSTRTSSRRRSTRV